MLTEERELRKLVERRIIVCGSTSINKLAKDTERVKFTSALLNSLKKHTSSIPKKVKGKAKEQAKERDISNLKYNSLTPKYIVLVLLGTVDSNIPALFDSALQCRQLTRSYVESTDDITLRPFPVPDASFNDAVDTTPGEYELLSPQLHAENTNNSTVIALKVSNWSTVSVVAKLHADGRALATIPVVEIKVIFEFSVTGRLTDYTKLNKHFRTNHILSSSLTLCNITVDDPKKAEKHDLVTKIQSMWRRYIVCRKFGERISFGDLEERSRKAIHNMWLQGLYDIIEMRDGGKYSVIIAQESDIRNDFMWWEFEDREQLYKRMRRMWLKLEARERIILQDKLWFQLEELFSLFSIYANAVLEFRFLQLCRRIGTREIKERNLVVLEEQQARRAVENDSVANEQRLKVPVVPHAMVIYEFESDVRAGVGFTVSACVVDRNRNEILNLNSFRKEAILKTRRVDPTAHKDEKLPSWICEIETDFNNNDRLMAHWKNVQLPAGQFLLVATADGIQPDTTDRIFVVE
eukprot:TRINITY_DN63377_c0_g1_i1.p1 TRINITY_DN63377_c0_g1~~TRINITY_DN63377_c0_g1_i1.p1  ORF type:complete len:607 (-),score=19.37 TRINITY_DN63377_c0_g1_i1:52-1617(-)